jgi:hypothetical protein
MRHREPVIGHTAPQPGEVWATKYGEPRSVRIIAIDGDPRTGWARIETGKPCRYARRIQIWSLLKYWRRVETPATL